jgi:hypothetical protein
MRKCVTANADDFSRGVAAPPHGDDILRTTQRLSNNSYIAPAWACGYYGSSQRTALFNAAKFKINL